MFLPEKGRYIPRYRARNWSAIFLLMLDNGSKPEEPEKQFPLQQNPKHSQEYVPKQYRKFRTELTKSMAKFVVVATRNPRFFRRYPVSSAASVALVPQTGYSPPAPNPAIPRATIIIQNTLFWSAYRLYIPVCEMYPSCDLPCEAVARTTPKIKNIVAATTPVLRPMRSIRTPKNSIPTISPIRYEFDKRDLILDEMPSSYLRYVSSVLSCAFR